MAGPNDLGEIFSVEKKCLILSAESSMQREENMDEWGQLYHGCNECVMEFSE